MKQYAALCCYFGRWPNHLQYWLTSCSYNQKIDFWLVTDISVEGYNVPDNVRVVSKSFANVQALIGQKFPDVAISLDRPYKLCDFKTAYGYIFSDIFSGYDYWGYYDIDTIWGNICSFIPANDGCHLVKIFPCGHLSFIRNVEPWNKVYELVNQVAGTPCRNNMAGKCVVTWQECFASGESHFYDEEGGLEPLFSHLMASGELSANDLYLSVGFDNILPPWRFDHFYSINFPEKSHFLVYQYECGRLERIYYQGLKLHREPISYVHFSKRNLSVPNNGKKTNSFSIVSNRFLNDVHWNVLTVLIWGRPRYLLNLFRRIARRIT